MKWRTYFDNAPAPTHRDAARGPAAARRCRAAAHRSVLQAAHWTIEGRGARPGFWASTPARGAPACGGSASPGRRRRVSVSAPATAHKMSRPHEISRASPPSQPIVPRASPRAKQWRYQCSSARQPSLPPWGRRLAVPLCGAAVTAYRHLSNIFVTPPTGPQVLPEIAAPPSCTEPLAR